MFSRRHAATFLVAAVAALAAPAGAQAHAQDAACPGADVVPAAGNLTQVASATLCLLNDERAAAGLHPLTVAQGLTQPSASYSARMVSENFFAHVAPDGATLTDRLEAGGYIEPDGDWTVGENIAWGQGEISTARSIMVAWMNSPGHRENILTPEFTEVGIGIVPGTPGDTSWGATYTTDFGDVIESWAVGEIAVTVSSVLHHDGATYASTLPAIAAFDRRRPLSDDEITALWPLVVLRGVVLVLSGRQQVRLDDANDYASGALDREFEILRRAAAVPLEVATARIRHALGRPPADAAAWEGAPILPAGIHPVVLDATTLSPMTCDTCRLCLETSVADVLSQDTTGGAS